MLGIHSSSLTIVSTLLTTLFWLWLIETLSLTAFFVVVTVDVDGGAVVVVEVVVVVETGVVIGILFGVDVVVATRIGIREFAPPRLLLEFSISDSFKLLAE